ncbi:NADH dehydrogenase [ubiquinone] 1 beta subcomplex subunit 5, mitochondrial [Diachasma alloeum]|uniref:NADH dehydrogenase [ubiquinone] 1 beta subcomplex subunit 5, mitochondrial n=1 Tax=Diachasma alloeum TaxID=454923 RepID=A0A4E0S156_9HYME|nr:NADH dehydrogenase [ubiquinone] 1 beta subcomplex subunit 5, mitochondrial [Diachasma alloeum]XP_015115900.1 NADH dehydrogenase [ubiquinone] 1 beta subcomplex subunit 5, mitochondrial [Diachasma alloeum]THK33090.1 SGDH subunit, NADH-dehydrogenase [Diachasma alloeum]
MAAWSGLLRSTASIFNRNKNLVVNNLVKNGTITRYMSGHDRTMQIVPSRWMWDKTKDSFHLYFMVAAIPITVVIFCVNIFIGPATLSAIPEGYVPKEWEYYRSPITRFLQRYVFTTDQKEYEKYCHFIWTEQEVMKCRELENKVMNLVKDRKDYQVYYYIPYTSADYMRRMAQKEKDQVELYSGN